MPAAPRRPPPIRTNTRTNCSGFQGLYLQTLSKRAYLVVEDADALYAEYTAHGVEFTRGLGNMPCHNREFAVKECDGRLLPFGASLESSACVLATRHSPLFFCLAIRRRSSH